jgi:hypothetical protein
MAGGLWRTLRLCRTAVAVFLILALPACKHDRNAATPPSLRNVLHRASMVVGLNGPGSGQTARYFFLKLAQFVHVAIAMLLRTGSRGVFGDLEPDPPPARSARPIPPQF